MMKCRRHHFIRKHANFKFIFLVLFGVAFTLPEVSRATPQIIRVDGSVFDSAGVPVTASKDIQIKAYDAASGGSLLWTSSVYNTAVTAGKFTINLDASTSSPNLVDRFGARTSSQAIYFQIEVDSGAANGAMDTPTVVLPRIRAKGTAFALNAASADALKGVTATVAEMNYLAGVSANVQTQINSISGTAAGVSGKVSKAGDSMSGALDVGAGITSTGTLTGATLNLTGVTASRFALFDSSKNLVSSVASVTDTEFGYLLGTTAAIQTQLDALAAGAGSTKVSKAGDSMSGALEVGAAITSTGTVTAATLNASGLTASRALTVDGSKNLVSSAVTDTELGYLSGVTSALAANINGVTANIQTQLNSKASGTFDGFSTLTDAATIAVDGSLGRIYKVTLGGNRTMGNPTNLVTGRMYTFVVAQDATGGRVLSWGTNYKGTIPTILSQTLVSQGAGTPIGSMTDNGGLAAAFDGNTSQNNAQSATKNSAVVGYVGKDWGVGNSKIVTRVTLHGDTEYGLSWNPGVVDVTLEGSSDNSTWVSLLSTSVTTYASHSLDVKTGIDTSTAYRYHRVSITPPAGANWPSLAELVFYESIPAANTTAVYPFVSDGTYLYYAVDPGVSGSGGNSVTSYTASRAIASDSSGSAVASSVTSTELGYLAGVTANIQTQFNSVAGGAATYETTAGSCDAAFTSVDTRTVYICNHGYSGYYNGSAYESQAACPTAATTSAGSPPASGFWAIQLSSVTLRTCSSTTKKACYETTSGSCGSGYTSTDTKTLYACGHGYSGYYSDTAVRPSYAACATTTPTTTAGTPPASGFWSIQLSSATVRVCCQ